MNPIPTEDIDSFQELYLDVLEKNIKMMYVQNGVSFGNQQPSLKLQNILYAQRTIRNASIENVDPGKGTFLSEIRELPWMRVGQEIELTAINQQECIICYDIFKTGDPVVMLCKLHVYHRNCLLIMHTANQFINKNRCILCSKDI